jgi:hypothetical protein
VPPPTHDDPLRPVIRARTAHDHPISVGYAIDRTSRW